MERPIRISRAAGEPPTTPLRVLLVVHDLTPGGAERIALRLASRWTADGIEVAIASGSLEGALNSLVADDLRIFTPKKPIVRSRYSRLAVALFAARTATALKPDVIFLPGNYYVGMAPILKIALCFRGPPVIAKLSNMLRRPGRGLAARIASGLSLAWKTAFVDHIVVMSQQLLAEARSVLPWSSQRYTVIDQPVLSDRGAPPMARMRQARESRPLIVAAGRLTAQKDFASLIEAITLVRQPCRLIIYGDGPDRLKLETLIKRFDLSAKVTLGGYVDDLHDALADARLFVLSSQYEGFPSVLVEALAAGVPVVSTRCSPAIPSIVGSPEAGLLISPGDVPALAGAIETMLDQPRPDPTALAGGVERFKIGRSADRYRALFERLAQIHALQPVVPL